VSAIDNKLNALATALQDFATAQKALVNAAIQAADALQKSQAALQPFVNFYATQLERQGQWLATSQCSLILSSATQGTPLDIQHLRAAHEALNAATTKGTPA
jgi:hypothetical protein